MSRVKTCVIANPTPGFFTVETCTEEDGTLTALKTPVIAWRIAEEIDDNDRDSDTHPVATPICTSEIGKEAVVLGPDGSVCNDDAGRWESVDAWLADENQKKQKHVEEARARKAAAAAAASVPVNPFAPRPTARTLALKPAR
jgi:hypothetical protein